MSARVARVLVWCDNQSTVRTSHDFFTRSLGFQSKLAPNLRRKRNFFPLFNNTYCASVSDGNLTLEFASVGWIAALRNAFRRPPASQMIALCIENVQARSLQENKPGVLESAMMLQPLVWLGAPSIHPLILCEVNDVHGQEEALETGKVDARVSEEDKTHVKEIVFGEADDRLWSSASLFLSLSEKRLSPGVMSFGTEGDYKGLVPVLRILPSPVSTLVVKVPDVNKACEGFQGIVRYENVGGNGDCEKDVQLSAPFLQGLNIRLSESEVFETRFVEQPQMIHNSAVTFDRMDMGSMSCSSVNGMEFKARLQRFPSRLLTSLGRSVRPQY